MKRFGLLISSRSILNSCNGLYKNYLYLRSSNSICIKKCWYSSEKDGNAWKYSFLRPGVFSSSIPASSTSTLKQYEALDRLDELLKSAKNDPKKLDDPAKLYFMESQLQESIAKNNKIDAWLTFKAIRNTSNWPSKKLVNDLIKQLLASKDVSSVKRAFATVLLIFDKHAKEKLVEMDTLNMLLCTLKEADMLKPAGAILGAAVKNLMFPQPDVCCVVLEQLGKQESTALLALEVFQCIVDFIRKSGDISIINTQVLNSALGASLTMKFVDQAENLLLMCEGMGIKADGRSFGLLAQLYIKLGDREKASSLEDVMKNHGVVPDKMFYSSLVRVYIDEGDLESASEFLVIMLKKASDSKSENCHKPDVEIYTDLVKAYLGKGGIKGIARFIINAEEVEGSGLESTTAVGVIGALESLGCLGKAHGIIDEMKAMGAKVGFGLYSSLLKAYCKQGKAAEANEVICAMNFAGYELDVSSYDAVTDVCMTAQDYKAAFSVFREMKKTDIASLQTSYLTIMTGLMEVRRPELMSAFLDEASGDYRIQVSVHDWNSVIHSYCKSGRLQDGRRTFNRMVHLGFQPNEQTYISLVNGYGQAEKYLNVIDLWKDMKRRNILLTCQESDHARTKQVLFDTFLCALVKGGYFISAMEIVEKIQDLKVFIDKWRYRQIFVGLDHKRTRIKGHRKDSSRVQAILAFRAWVGIPDE